MDIPAEQLAKLFTLPTKPAGVTLTGTLVELRPLDLDADTESLHRVSCGTAFVLAGRAVESYDPDARVWRYMSGGPFADPGALRTWLGKQVTASDGLPLTVVDRATGTPIGVANFLANVPAHLKIELGSIWYGPIAQRTGASREATRLMLGHAFALGYRRVEWKCDARNEPSRRAALSYGFTFEGIQDAHYIVKDRNRDTAWYRLLDHEFRTM